MLRKLEFNIFRSETFIFYGAIRVGKGNIGSKELSNYFTLGQEKFLDEQQTEKFLKNSENKAPGTCRNVACTNFAAEKVSVDASSKNMNKKDE